MEDRKRFDHVMVDMVAPIERSASSAAILASLRASTLIHFGDIPMLVDPASNEIHCNGQGLNESSEGLAEMVLTVGKFVEGGRRSARAFFEHAIALDGFVWNMAMHESVPSGSVVNTPGGRFSLLSWPRFGDWGAPADIVVLAAALMGNPMTLAQAAVMSGVAKQKISKFLRACILARIGVTVEV